MLHRKSKHANPKGSKNKANEKYLALNKMLMNLRWWCCCRQVAVITASHKPCLHRDLWRASCYLVPTLEVWILMVRCSVAIYSCYPDTTLTQPCFWLKLHCYFSLSSHQSCNISYFYLKPYVPKSAAKLDHNKDPQSPCLWRWPILVDIQEGITAGQANSSRSPKI